MTTETIILITWFLAGIIATLLIIYYAEENIKTKDILEILLGIFLGYLTLIATIIGLAIQYSDVVIWKHPKNR
jgi:disulfide bond formation protein DsbB